MIRLFVCSSTRGEAKRRFASAALGVAPMRRALAALAIAAELGRELAEASALDSVAARSRTVRVFERPPEATTPRPGRTRSLWIRTSMTSPSRAPRPSPS